ncbi:MAG: hypothetical protein ACI4EG_12575 [Fusicatenibacter sp.]
MTVGVLLALIALSLYPIRSVRLLEETTDSEISNFKGEAKE